MARQLTLIESRRNWRLDERTREIGRRGLAEARAALAAHRPATPEPAGRPSPDDRRPTAA